MIVRRDQIQVFEKASVENYVGELAAHCHEFSPSLCATLQPAELRSAMRYGILQAERHGFNQRGPVRFYVDLMIVLGSGFDTDPQYPWAAEILGKKEDGNQMDRAMKLHSRSTAYLGAVNGLDNFYSLQALADLERLLRCGLTFHQETLDKEAMGLMAEIHPRKTAETGAESLRLLIADAKERGRSYGFGQARSLALVLTLMFAFGHRFDTDPLFPWIRRTLERSDPVNPEEAAMKLERRAILWLQAVLRNAKVTD